MLLGRQLLKQGPMAKAHDPQFSKLVKKLINTQRPQVLKSLLETLNPVEISNILIQLKLRHQLAVLEMLDRETASEVLTNLQDSSSVLESSVEEMSPEQLSGFIGEMPGDDAADFVSMMEEDQADAILETLPPKERDTLTQLLQYDEESAGGLMTPFVVSILKDQTVGQAIREIQAYVKKQPQFQLFYTAYVVDEYRHLIGTVSVTELLLADKRTLIQNLMNPEVVAVDQDLDQEEVLRLAKEYDLVVVPVIDKHLRLIGRVTIDDLVDVMAEEYHEDIGHFAGTGDEEVSETSIIKTSRDRLPWLLIGLIGGFISARVMSTYENALINLPEVAFFIPLVAALGGSIGIQSSSIVVRGLATGAIQTSDLIVRLSKELRVGFLTGFICSMVLVGMTWYLSQNLSMALTSGTAHQLVVCFAAFVGSTIPILMKRMNIDPALATGPFITTSNDIIGIAIYLAITFNYDMLSLIQ